MAPASAADSAAAWALRSLHEQARGRGGLHTLPEQGLLGSCSAAAGALERMCAPQCRQMWRLRRAWQLMLSMHGAVAGLLSARLQRQGGV